MLVIGERINGMYKDVGKAIKERDKATIQDLAKKQVAGGASMLDVNVGPAAKDAVDAMKWLVEIIQEVVDVGLALDSTKANVIEAGLKATKNKAMINSTTADKEKLDILVPMAKEHKARLIGLTLGKSGVPRDRAQRSEYAAAILTACVEAGFNLDDLYIDPIVLPVNVAQPQALEALEALREFRLLYNPPPKTVVGLSNVSQGTDNRSLINRTFLIKGQTDDSSTELFGYGQHSF